MAKKTATAETPASDQTEPKTAKTKTTDADTEYAVQVTMKQANVSQKDATKIVTDLGKKKEDLVEAGRNGRVSECREILNLTE